MSVCIQTSLGDIVIDLFFEDVPEMCKNFLKLCRIRYYNSNLIYSIQKDFMLQSGCPEGTGTGGGSIYHILDKKKPKFLKPTILEKLRHTKKGSVGFAGKMVGSQFYITLSSDRIELDGKFSIFGEVVDGMDVLDKLNNVIVERKTSKPLKNYKIRHTMIIFDPFEDIPGMELHEYFGKSPEPIMDELDIEFEDEEAKLDEAERKELHAARDQKRREKMLFLLGSRPDEDIAPPDNVVFVCQLNKDTEDEDLQNIFEQCGEILECSIIRDYKTGRSLNYAFITYTDSASCLRAFKKLNNALIDERRIKVDFSQSVAKQWAAYARERRQKYLKRKKKVEREIEQSQKKKRIK